MVPPFFLLGLTKSYNRYPYSYFTPVIDPFFTFVYQKYIRVLRTSTKDFIKGSSVPFPTHNLFP